MKIKRFRHSFLKKDLIDLTNVILNGQIAIGDNVKIFEKKIGEIVNHKNVCVVSNGFSAIFLSLKALGIKKGDLVALPIASTCHSVRNAVLASGANPLFLDFKPNLPISDYKDFRISSDKLKAIISINHFGIIDDVKHYNLGIPVIEDSSQSFGITNDFSDRVCTISSFYATKIINSVDGGVIYSKSKKIIEKCLDLRSYQNKFDDNLRYNFKLSNVNATLGLSQLNAYERLIKRRKLISEEYFESIKKSDLIDKTIYQKIKIFYKFPIVFKEDLNQKEIFKLLSSLKIPCTKELVLNKSISKGFPAATSLVNRFYSLPIYPSLTRKEINYIIKQIKRVF